MYHLQLLWLKDEKNDEFILVSSWYYQTLQNLFLIIRIIHNYVIIKLQQNLICCKMKKWKELKEACRSELKSRVEGR